VCRELVVLTCATEYTLRAMDKQQQQAAKKKGGQPTRGGVLKQVVGEVKKDVVNAVAYACQGNSK
jgi:hypothetical protein